MATVTNSSDDATVLEIIAPTTDYAEKTGSESPFAGISLGRNPEYATPVLVDVDGDGDLDLVIGERAQNNDRIFIEYAPTDDRVDLEPIAIASNPSITYYENQGSATNPNYVEQTGTDNPFNDVYAGFYSFISPSFGDVDKDGDLDLIVGDGYIAYYENEGSATNPDYVEQVNADNPFGGMYVSGNRAPALVDIDDDGDADLLVDRNGDGYLQYYRNVRTAQGANYVAQADADNPFYDVSGEYVIGTGSGYSAPAFADFDDDGDLDALFGLASGEVAYFENHDGTYKAVSFSENPVSNVGVSNYNSAAAAGDVDGDGDIDILLGDGYGELKFYENTRTAAELTPSENGTAFEITSFGAGNTLMLEIDKVAQFSEILIFKVDDADGSNPEQVGSFAVLQSGQIEGSFAPEMMLDSNSVATGEFFQAQLVENGMTRLATVSRMSNGQLSLDFGGGTVAMIQPGTAGTTNLMIGDADGIDLGDSGNPMSLEFSVYREANYNNTVGLYSTDTAEGGIEDPVTSEMLMPGDAGYKEAVMARRLDVMLTGENGAVQSFSAELTGENRFIASFLIADGSDFNSEEVYFSHMGANSNGNDHTKMLGSNAFGFEDMAGLGDRDYNDIVVSFTATEMLNPK